MSQQDLDPQLTLEYTGGRWTDGKVVSPEEGEKVKLLYFKHTALITERVKKSIPCRLDIPYEDGDSNKYDLYGNLDGVRNGQVLVFVHGGYWRNGSRGVSAWMVEPFFKEGIITAVVGFDTSTKDLKDIVSQVRTAIKSIQKATKNYDIWICGNSSGGHLISSAVLLDEDKNNPLKVTGMILIAGLYQLEPLICTPIAALCKFDKEMLMNNSIFKLTDEEISSRAKERCEHILLANGSWESPSFKRQSESLYKVLKESNHPSVSLEIFPNENHFSLAEKLSESDFSLTKKIIKLMKR